MRWGFVRSIAHLTVVMKNRIMMGWRDFPPWGGRQGGRHQIWRKTVIRARLLGQRGIERNINTQHFKCFIIYLFLAVLGYAAAGGLSLVAANRGYALDAVHGLLTVVASLVTEPGSRRVGSRVAAPRLQSTGSLAVALGLSCSATCGIFPIQGSNLCLPH